ncbi:kinase-like protein [Dentipellis sp. KUC8613]|nr:kinase-like protein [Dentipellis sp. KUC8613]
MDAQDGPWSVSVAENPGDSTSYSLYVKTPTHNLTLSRTAHEIVDLHHKLHDSYPSVKLPVLPIDTNSLPQPAKRKSAFLNTLSRLASPASKSSAARHASKPSLSGSSPRSAAPSVLATPLGSPGQESNDPFSSFGDEAPLSSPTASTNPLLTGLAAYLTTVSNDQLLRQARVWKRFVRVRTDDLESVRVERAIKRVRSDLAAHMTSPSTVDVQMLSSSVTSSVNGDAEKNEEENGDGEEDAEETAAVDGDEATAEDRPETPRSPKKPIEDAAADDEADSVVTNGIDEGEKTPSTPVAGDTVASRIPRSQSADPDKAARLSRIFSASSTKLDGTSSPQSASASASQTEDDASIGTSHAARKKRSKSADPKRQLSQRKVQVSDFEMLRVLGKGCAGKVLLVRHRSSADLYALKAITKRHVLAHQELQHTLTEQAVLKRMAAEGADPFVVKLWWSFHDKENLFLVMDFHPGGDLATQLARWGRLGRDRARFYAAEIVEGVEGLHNAGVIYRDLKPENILIAADGHIVLTDFGLSKEFPRRSAAITAPSTPNGQRNGFQTASQTPPATPYWMNGNGEERSQDLAQPWPSRGSDATSTFCGTAEYLAPEVIQGLPYSYEVDWWSFGTMLYEMLTGITPFWADNHSDMYVRVLQDELQFPDDRAMDQDTKSLIRGLLQRNPALRINEPRIKRHPYFSMIDWSHVYYKRYIPPYIPPIDPQNASDTQNFDDTFLDMEPVINDENDAMDTDGERDQTDTDRTDGEDSVTTPSQSRSSSIHPVIEDDSVDVFDGYSFKGRNSVIIDDDAESGSSVSEEEDEDAATRSILAELNGEDAAAKKAAVSASEEQTPEPKTPEARPTGLPETPDEKATPSEPAPVDAAKPTVKIDTSARAKTDKPVPQTPKSPVAAAAAAAAALTIAEEKRKDPKKPVTTKAPNRNPRPTRNRREKSGVPALDRDLSDANDEDEAPTEREEEDDDWDFIEAAGEDRNGAKGNSLFARGVVDRYKLAVFRKGSTPNRSVSGMSQASDLPASEAGSPVPSDKQRRGRTPGLPFRKTPKQFLRPKSPPASHSSRGSKTLNHSTSATLSTASSLHPPSSQFGKGTVSTMSPSMSLKSKESATSIGSPNSSSDTSMNDDGRDADVVETVKAPAAGFDDGDKQKNKKLRKYKEGAEKVLSLFSSPR